MGNQVFFGGNVTNDSAVQAATRGGGIAFSGACQGELAVRLTEKINTIIILENNRGRSELARNLLFSNEKVGKVKKAIIDAYPDCEKGEWPHDIAKLSGLGGALERVGAGKQAAKDIETISACTNALYEAFIGIQNERYLLESPSGIQNEAKEITQLLLHKAGKLLGIAEKTLEKGGLMTATLEEEGSLSGAEMQKMIQGGASKNDVDRAHTLIFTLDSLQKLEEHFGL